MSNHSRLNLKHLYKKIRFTLGEFMAPNFSIWGFLSYVIYEELVS